MIYIIYSSSILTRRCEMLRRIRIHSTTNPPQETRARSIVHRDSNLALGNVAQDLHT